MTSRGTPLLGEGRSILIPALLLLLGGGVYGGIVTANKIAIEAGFPFVAYTFWQTCLAGLILLAYTLLRGKLPGITVHHLRHYVLVSSLGIVIPLLILTYIATRVPAGALTLIFALAPPFAYVLTFALGRERFRWLSVAGVAFGFLGILMIVVPAESLPSREAAIWMIVALAVPIAVGSNNLVMAYLRPPEATTVTLVCGLQLAGAAITFPLMLATSGFYGFWQVPTDGLWALAWATTAQIVAFLTVLEVVRLAGPVYTAQINYVMVIAGFLWALALFDEGLSLWIWAALGVMLVGLILANAGTAQAYREAAAERA